MQPNVPIPTDSLYKFAALFGIVLILASAAAFVVAYNSAKGEIVQLALDYMQLDQGQEEISPQMKQFLEQRIDIAASNRDTYMFFVSLTLVVGCALVWWGFGKWSRIQPLHDELLELEVAKARKEVHGDLEPHSLAMKPPPETKEPTISARLKKWRASRKTK